MTAFKSCGDFLKTSLKMHILKNESQRECLYDRLGHPPHGAEVVSSIPGPIFMCAPEIFSYLSPLVVLYFGANRMFENVSAPLQGIGVIKKKKEKKE